MPRKAILAGVLLSGLLLAGCEWCGNCKGLCGRDGGSSYASGPNLTGPKYSAPLTSTQTPSSLVANPSAGRTPAVAKTTATPGGIVPASGESTLPYSSKKSSDPNVGQANYFGASRPSVPSADDLPTPEPFDSSTPPESAPTLQPPPRSQSSRPIP